MHLETIKGDGSRFFALLRETAQKKPVIVLKGGRTEAGAKAAMSHTGSLVQGSTAVFDAALKQAGAIKAETLDEFFYLGKAFSYLKPPRGNRIAIATFPGGEAVLTTDAIYQNGLVMAKPGKSSYEKLSKTFPAWEIDLNPYDFGIIYTFNLFNNNHGAFIEAMADRVTAALERLASTGHGDVKKLQGRPNEFRLRVGKWRVFFDRDTPGTSS